MIADRYLDRIGVESAAARPPDLDALERLQRAHQTAVPFETLSITGDPFGDRDGEGVSLALADLFGKVVEREHGGFCYELNGLFGWLLADLGFDVERRSARVYDDGEPGLPADHLALVVSLDRRYLVDVGFGATVPRGPVPLEGSRSFAVGPDWRVVESERPDADYVVQSSEAGEWTPEYCFRDRQREMGFFEATCEHHQHAPESPFTGEPFVTVQTDRGHRTLSTEHLTVVADGEREKRAVGEEEWHDVLEREFGIRYRTSG